MRHRVSRVSREAGVANQRSLSPIATSSDRLPGCRLMSEVRSGSQSRCRLWAFGYTDRACNRCSVDAPIAALVVLFERLLNFGRLFSKDLVRSWKSRRRFRFGSASVTRLSGAVLGRFVAQSSQRQRQVTVPAMAILLIALPPILLPGYLLFRSS